MAGCGCSVPTDGGASRRNRDVRELSDGVLFAQMEIALCRFDALARRPIWGFVVYALGAADRERQKMTGLEYRRLRLMAGETVPEGLDDGRMVWVPIDTFRDLMAKAAARRDEWAAPACCGADTAAA